LLARLVVRAEAALTNGRGAVAAGRRQPTLTLWRSADFEKRGMPPIGAGR
jgi:hypothetical protein